MRKSLFFLIAVVLVLISNQVCFAQAKAVTSKILNINDVQHAVFSGTFFLRIGSSRYQLSDFQPIQ